MTKFIKDIFPGVFLALFVALGAKFLERLLPLQYIGESVLALFLGIFLNNFIKTDKFSKGLKFTSKKILKLAIIFLGASLNIAMVLHVGKLSLTVMVFTLLTCFGGGHFIGKALGLNWRMSSLISAGTGICGGSAIAALAPVIDAEDVDVAYAMSATFIFDIAMIVLFPIMGRALNLSDIAYGLWTGTAVNDTSSVVAAGYAYSEAAGDFATMVKLTRTLSIIPTVLVFSIISQKKKSDRSKGQGVGVKISSIFPYFILGFLALSLINSFGFISESLAHNLKTLSKFLMVMALGSIGLNTSFKDLQKSGINPMVHGFVISLLVVVVSLLVQVFMGLV
ncbi:YeiH family protein [Neofamilia massiliensis]|uniref:YeiH family protein n=1 Tax=Neofamilia massiliensis TaxID=1673724 RepID=UPI0009E830C3|nr:putative sulfate exporter family transporter [Neofamilia massiliensis]